MSGIDKNTVLMLHMNDNNFKDECGHEVINNGVILDTSNKKFGDGSGDFRNSKYLQINLNSDKLYENNEFTIEAICYLNSNAQIAFLNSSNFSTSKGFCIGVGSPQHWFFQQGTISIGTTDTALMNQWVHIAVVYKENNISIFENGKKMVSTNITLNNTFNSIYIGFRLDNSWHFNGNIDELRISNIARWTSDFTPPTHEYTSVKFLIKDNNKYKYIDNNNNIITISNEDILYNNINNYGMYDLTNINSNIINILDNNNFNINMLK